MATASGEGILMIEDARLDSGAPTDNDPTAVWLRQAKAGDASAFEKIIVLHQRQVLTTSLRLLGDLRTRRMPHRRFFCGCTSTSIDFRMDVSSLPGSTASPSTFAATFSGGGNGQQHSLWTIWSRVARCANRPVPLIWKLS